MLYQQYMYSYHIKPIFIYSSFTKDRPELARGDYERAPRNAFMTIFPHIVVSGCLFHYSKAIWTKVKKLQPNSTYARNSNLNKWIRSIMSLPLLPQDGLRGLICLLFMESRRRTTAAKFTTKS